MLPCWRWLKSASFSCLTRARAMQCSSCQANIGPHTVDNARKPGRLHIHFTLLQNNSQSAWTEDSTHEQLQQPIQWLIQICHTNCRWGAQAVSRDRFSWCRLFLYQVHTIALYSYAVHACASSWPMLSGNYAFTVTTCIQEGQLLQQQKEANQGRQGAWSFHQRHQWVPTQMAGCAQEQADYCTLDAAEWYLTDNFQSWCRSW